MYWTWLAVGLGRWRVIDAWDYDWVTSAGGGLVIEEPGSVADEEGHACFEDVYGEIRVEQRSYAWGAEPNEDFVLVAYTVVNSSGLACDSVFIGHRTDYDVLGDSGYAPTDMADFDTLRSLAVMWDTGCLWHVGVKLLAGVLRGYHNGWHALSDSDKYEVLSEAGTDPTTPYPNDWCLWLSTGPYSLQPGDSCTVAFAFLAGEDRRDIERNADAAQEMWNRLDVCECYQPAVTPASHTSMAVKSIVRFEGRATGSLLDCCGRNVRELHPGPNDVRHLAPGVYFVREHSAYSIQQSGRDAPCVTKVVVTR